MGQSEPAPTSAPCMMDDVKRGKQFFIGIPVPKLTTVVSYVLIIHMHLPHRHHQVLYLLAYLHSNHLCSLLTYLGYLPSYVLSYLG
jgi:phosphatidylserine synthase